MRRHAGPHRGMAKDRKNELILLNRDTAIEKTNWFILNGGIDKKNAKKLTRVGAELLTILKELGDVWAVRFGVRIHGYKYAWRQSIQIIYADNVDYDKVARKIAEAISQI